MSETLPSRGRAAAATKPAVSARWGWFIGYFWSSVWLFWLISPLKDAWQEGSWAGVAAIVAFAATYLRHFHRRGWVFSDDTAAVRDRLTAEPSGLAAGRYSIMVALAVLAMVTIGQPGAACLVFTGIASMWTFDVRPAFALAVTTGTAYVLLWHVIAGWHSDYGSIIGLSFGTVACLAGRMSAERQMALDASLEDAALLRVQEERNRMARDLHDILGHSLTVITMKAELAGKLVDRDPQAAKAQIAELEQLSRSALADVRTTVSGYREMSLSGEIARARTALADAGVRAQVPSSVDAVSPDLRELFAWAVREATTNVIRHSGAQRCTITLSPTRLVIHDDGHGCAAAGADGNGLAGLRERAAAVGAAVTIDGSRGFTLTVGAPHSDEGEPS